MGRSVVWHKFMDVSKNVAPLSSEQSEAAGSSEPQVNFYRTTRHEIRKNDVLCSHGRNNLKLTILC